MADIVLRNPPGAGTGDIAFVSPPSGVSGAVAGTASFAGTLGNQPRIAIAAVVVEALLSRSADTRIGNAVVEVLAGRPPEGTALSNVLVEALTAGDIVSTRIHGALVEVLILRDAPQIAVAAVILEALIGRLPDPEDVPLPLYTSIAERRFGRDLLLHPAAFVPATATGDWPTIAGRPNLHAAVRRRILTTPGQLVHRGEYGAGIELFVGELNAPAERARFAAAARQNLLRDPRIEDAQVRVREPEAGQAEVSLQIRPTGEIEADTVSVVTEAG